MSEPTSSEAFTELARRFLGAIEEGDVATVRECYHPDARIWHNNDGIEQTVDENLRVLTWMAHTLVTRRYDVQRLEALPDGFLQQHVLRATLPSGAEWALPACVIVRVRDGLIIRLDEYLDSAHVAALTTALAAG
jgi:ketosteroid isomerase-like protein